MAEAEKKKILVHEKALAHLSRGLYRSPASALRELVSNAWDANAKNVRIDTNYPHFMQVSVEDDGDGFTLEEFERLMAGGIGNSEKRLRAETLINDRPTIGRLGIGMLGIAQICGAFTLTSVPKGGKPFSARVHLYDLLKEKLDAPQTEQEEKFTEVHVGEYQVLESQNGLKKGTRIVADDIHPTFSLSFRESLECESFSTPPLDWKKALSTLSKVHSLQQMGDYWKLLWELAASCPVPYLAPDAVPKGLIKDEDAKLRSYDFVVRVDDIVLSKPIFLKGNPGGYTTNEIERTSKKVYGREVIYHGYLVVQEGLQLRPDELRGIMIRIKGIGIGYYDASLLDYRFNEGPRSRWITGEIFVETGLEDALNIDRDSFNRFHPQYRAVQSHVHKILREKVFPQVYKNIEVRSDERQAQKTIARKANLKSIVSNIEGINVKIVAHKTKEESIPEVKLERKRDELLISLPSSSEIEVKSANRQLAASILAIYEVAEAERTAAARREKFRKLLFDLLRKW